MSGVEKSDDGVRVSSTDAINTVLYKTDCGVVQYVVV